MGERDYATPVACAFIGAFFPLIGFLSIVVRFSFRLARKSGLGWDDWFCIPGWLFNLAIGLGLIIGVAKKSVGYHLIASDASDVETGGYDRQQISVVMYQLEWLLTSFCFLALGFIKLSVLFLYRRIFDSRASGGKRIFRFINWTLIVLVSLWTIIFSLTSFFMCGKHFSYMWSNWYLLETHCLDILTQNTWGCIFDVVGDVFILLLPLPLVWKLQMPTGKKIAIVATLLTGILSLICGIFRLYINVKYNSSVLVESGKVEYVLGVSSLDVIGMTTILLFWTQVEVGVANVAVCLPAMRPGRLLTSNRSKHFLERFRMTWLASSKGESSGTRSRKSYLQQKDGPVLRSSQYHHSSDDDLTAETRYDGISKTVDVEIQTVGRYPPQTEADVASRYQLLQYPSRVAQKEIGPFDSV